MAEVIISPTDILKDGIIQHIKDLCNKAYEQGVEDGRSKYNLPYTLKQEHLAEIFQVEKPTLPKIINHPTFPRLEIVRARYPRDKVLKWINDNSSIVKSNFPHWAVSY